MGHDLRQYFLEAKMDASQIPAWFAGMRIMHPDFGHISPMFTQVTGLNLLFCYQRAALYDVQGTGKTLPGQAAMIWHAAVGNRAVALMPPILLEQFRQSLIDTFEGVEDRLSIEIYHGSPTERNAQATRWLTGNKTDGSGPPPPHIVLTTPALFLKEFMLFEQLGFKSLTCDECDYFSNPDTKTYAAIESYLTRNDDATLCGMHGTPAKNNLDSLYGYIRMVTPWVYKSHTSFANQHINYKKIPVRFNKGGSIVERDIQVIDSFKNLELLRKNLYLQARRIEEKDMPEKLPPVLFPDFPITLSPKHAKRYEHFVTAKVMEFKDGTSISGEQTATLRQICMQSVMQPSILHLNEESQVMVAIEELLKQIDVDKHKVFIGCYYRKTVEMIAERFKQHNTVTIYGGNSGSRNEKNKQIFLDDPKCRILVANYESGGVGLNLQGVCHHGISAEPTTVPGDFDQWWKRLSRKGQKYSTFFYMIVVKGTAWVKATNNMRKKRDINNSVVSRDDLIAEMLGKDRDEQAAKAA